MQCQDVSKLRTPLNEVCITTDIGCVPIVSGKPDCVVQPDELPLAYDPSTSTLWLFSCQTREWVAMQKFALDQLQDLNLDNLNNICNLLKIAVYYNPGTGNIQGTITLQEFTEKLLECLKLETNVLVIGSGPNNQVKISIEGLDGLPPTYVKGDNVWFTGTGTENDPVVVHTYDPICEWPVKSQAQVDAANTKHLGACVDGEMARVPFPPKICELPEKTEAQVKASNDKKLIACVDGSGAKVPYPKEVCELEQRTEAQVAAANDKNLVACVDGQGVKIPYPKILEQKPACESPTRTSAQITTNDHLLACVSGEQVRIPVPSSLFAPEYLCVPQVTGTPQGAPTFGSGPIRVGCNGELWVWLCEQDAAGRWVEVRYNQNSLSNLNVNNVTDICNNFRMQGWYSDTTGDPCVREVKFTLNQLMKMLESCEGSDCPKNLRFGTGSSSACVGIRRQTSEYVVFQVRDYNVISGTFDTAANNAAAAAAIAADPDQTTWVKNRWGNYDWYGGAGIITVNVTNTYGCPALLSVRFFGKINAASSAVQGGATFVLSEKLEEDYFSFGVGSPYGVINNAAGSPSIGIIELPNEYTAVSRYNYGTNSQHISKYYVAGNCTCEYQKILEPDENCIVYGQYWLLSRLEGVSTPYSYTWHARNSVYWNLYKNVGG